MKELKCSWCRPEGRQGSGRTSSTSACRSPLLQIRKFWADSIHNYIFHIHAVPNDPTVHYIYSEECVKYTVCFEVSYLAIQVSSSGYLGSCSFIEQVIKEIKRKHSYHPSINPLTNHQAVCLPINTSSYASICWQLFGSELDNHLGTDIGWLADKCLC